MFDANSVQQLLQRATRLELLTLENCEEITADFLVHRLRHQCARLRIFSDKLHSAASFDLLIK